MTIKNKSFFKEEQKDRQYFESWVNKLEKSNSREYNKIIIPTALGNTMVYGIEPESGYVDTIVIFPGARTTALIWDFDKGLELLRDRYRIFMVETNGLPNLSDGSSPDIKSMDYGNWAAEVVEKLGIQKAHFLGASFGGLIIMKLAQVNSKLIKSAFLLNPGCLQPFSMKFRNLYYNILPIISPTPSNVAKFLKKAVFCAPEHDLTSASMLMLTEYEVFALKRYKDNTQKPYFMGVELTNVDCPVYLVEGDKDLLFPFEKNIANAKKLLKNLVEVKVFENVGHGIETHAPALNYIHEKLLEITTN